MDEGIKGMETMCVHVQWHVVVYCNTVVTIGQRLSVRNS